MRFTKCASHEARNTQRPSDAVTNMPHTTTPRSLRTLADGFLEAPIVTSFTNIGYSARKRLHHWTPLGNYDLTGKVVVLTGASTGIGYAAAQEFASLGATLVMISRSAERIERAADETRRFKIGRAHV